MPLAAGQIAALRFIGPRRSSEYDLWEAIDDSSPDPREHIYSCIALCLRQWAEEWPALGGTRWVPSDTDEPNRWQEEARHQAVELAMAMYIKNSVLRKAASSLDGGVSTGIYRWQGGKGVIWTPFGAKLTEHRLRCHGRLIERMGGRYVGSKDKGIGTDELKVIAEETPHTIGLGCGRDTGEATAFGVLSGLEQAAREAGLGHGEKSLSGVSILVIGAGKVGLPLTHFLHERQARVFLFDPELSSEAEAVGAWIAKQQKFGAEVDEERHGATLRQLSQAGRIISPDREHDALLHPEIQVVSPNGGFTEWLSRPPAGTTESRAELLAANASRNGHLRLVLGAGNDQVSATREGRDAREQTLKVLADAGIQFVPDPLVSPGGVIAVSHELAPPWDAEQVNDDSRRIVKKSVEQVFRVARELGGTDAVTMYRAFEALVETPEWT